jgi:hypothetical protein
MDISTFYRRTMLLVKFLDRVSTAVISWLVFMSVGEHI